MHLRHSVVFVNMTSAAFVTTNTVEQPEDVKKCCFSCYLILCPSLR